MPKRPSIALIVPAYNMAEHLSAVWSSIEAVGLIDVLAEMIFVDDGSTDGTSTTLKALTANQPKACVLSLSENRGRFWARQTAAAKARSERLLFIDARVTLPVGFSAAVQAVSQQATNVVGCIDIDTSRSRYCLYWQRTHEFIFWRHYRDTQTPLTLTPENYDRYLKGTTLFICSRELFLEACEAFGDAPPLSDDTHLMRLMVDREPIVVHPALRGQWLPRERLLPFLARLWERGPQFTEYHVICQRGFFFWIVAAGVLTLAGLGLLVVLAPAYGLTALAGMLGLVVLSAALFSRTPWEFLRLAPLHLAVVITCGLAVLRGILLHCWSSRRPLADGQKS